MPTGTISKLVPLTMQSHVENSQINSQHNDRGYGQIRGEEGDELYFPHDAVVDCSFDELWVGQEVAYETDPAQADRAVRITLVNDDAELGRGGVKNPPPQDDRVGTSGKSGGAVPPKSKHQEVPTMAEHTDSKDLQTVLAELEQRLETPVVPGELDDWLESLHEPLQRAGNVLQQVIAHQHPPLIKSIRREDPELQRRSEQLQEEDQRLLQEYQEIVHELDRIQPAIESIEPHESKADDLMKEFTDRALDLIIAARKQELALQTWSVEALERDRGPVD